MALSQAFRHRIELARRAAKEDGIGAYRFAPPLWHGLWALGIPARPPHFCWFTRTGVPLVFLAVWLTVTFVVVEWKPSPKSFLVIGLLVVVGWVVDWFWFRYRTRDLPSWHELEELEF